MTVATAPAPTQAEVAAVRRAALCVRRTARQYEVAAGLLELTTGALAQEWRGAAAAAALGALHSLRAEADDAAATHAEAADVLTICATQLEEAADTHRRAEALQAPRLAAEAADAAASATARAAMQLRELAQRAPVRALSAVAPLTAADQLRGVGRGAVDAVWGSVVSAAGLTLPRMLLDAKGWTEQVRELGRGASYAVSHPGEAAGAAVGLDLLQDGRYGEWVGGLIPDLAGTFVSGGALPVGRRTADLADDLAELGDGVDDLQRVHRRSADSGGPVTPLPGAEIVAGYPTRIQDLAPDRRVHILDGDPPQAGRRAGGGHRAGTGKPGKSEFPASWSDDDIIRRVMETAMHPQRAEAQERRRNLVAYGMHDGVLIKVAVSPEGHVVTAFPLRGPGVVMNALVRRGGQP